jgi:serine phosphatase RsbU (regulator of sigma subunit)
MISQLNIKPYFIFVVAIFLSSFTSEAKANELDSLLRFESAMPDDTLRVNALIDIARIYIDSDFIKAIKYSKKSLKIARYLNYNEGIINSLSCLADAYDYTGRYSKAQKLNLEILSLYKKSGNEAAIYATYNNIGIIHYYLGNYNEAIEFTTKALNYYLSQKDKEGISMCYNNIANSYSDQGDYETALDYYGKSLALYRLIEDEDGISLSKGNIGEVYIEQTKYDDAFIQLISALNSAEKTNNEWQQANLYMAIGDLKTRQFKTDKAIEYLLKSIAIFEKIGAEAELAETYKVTSIAFEQKGDFAKSLHYIKLYNVINDQLFSENSSEKIAEMNALYEIDEKEKEILQQNADASLQKSQQKAIIIGSSIGFLLLFIIVGISVRGNLSKRKVNATLESQKLQIEAKNRDITDSIQYAKRIQGAILPSEKQIKKHLKDSFVLYLPKDIVAGDFYWMEQVAPPSKNKESTILFAAADCTGHGVPGAMVSVVCQNALYRAVNEFNLYEPAKILDKVTELVVATFDHSEASISDGMDIALCSLNLSTNELQYAGANNSLYLIRNEELIEIKSDKQPVGKFSHQQPFTNHAQQLFKDDKIYLFTDGYADQFGGEKGKKFKYKQFRSLLLAGNNNPMPTQLKALADSFDQWKGDLEQIDDVCVIGVKI